MQRGNFNSIIHEIIYYAVPGISGSQLSVNHRRESNFLFGLFDPCNTFGSSVPLWVSKQRVLKKFDCFLSELTYVRASQLHDLANFSHSLH